MVSQLLTSFTSTTDLPRADPTVICHSEEFSATLRQHRRSSILEKTQEIPSFHPKNAIDAAERAMCVSELAATGALQEEVLQLGVSPDWLSRMHADTPTVAISEQVMPLSTLFAKLGKEGRPEMMREALFRLQDIASALKYFSSKDVKTGLLGSPEHSVSRTGITSGFYMSVPNFEFITRQEGEKFRRIRLISNNQLDRLEGSPYRSLELKISSLDEISRDLHKDLTRYQKQIAIAERGYIRQATFNGNSRDQERPMDREMYQREKSLLRSVRRYRLDTDSMKTLVDIWDSALATFKEISTASQTVKYCNFVQALNSRIAERILPTLPFEHLNSLHIDRLATLGVSDWKQFLSRFLDAGLIKDGEPILRYLDQNGKHRLVMLENLNSLRVKVRGTDTLLHLEQLQEESAKSVIERGFPTILPIAVMRYWAMYVVGNGITLEDGMPYEKLNRIYKASLDSSITAEPRGLLIYPYTDLNKFEPEPGSDPYAKIKEEFSILDFLRRAPEAISDY